MINFLLKDSTDLNRTRAPVYLFTVISLVMSLGSMSLIE